MGYLAVGEIRYEIPDSCFVALIDKSGYSFFHP